MDIHLVILIHEVHAKFKGAYDLLHIIEEIRCLGFPISKMNGTTDA